MQHRFLRKPVLLLKICVPKGTKKGRAPNETSENFRHLCRCRSPRRPEHDSLRLGHLAYVLQGAQQLGKIESYNTRVEYDGGGVVEADLLYGSMSNSTSVAGIVRLPSEMVCLGDGMSELVLVKNPGSVAGFGEIVESVLSQRFDSENLLILHTRQARFIFDKPVSWTRDGEAGGEYQDITLKNYECPVQMIF